MYNPIPPTVLQLFNALTERALMTSFTFHLCQFVLSQNLPTCALMRGIEPTLEREEYVPITA